MSTKNEIKKKSINIEIYCPGGRGQGVGVAGGFICMFDKKYLKLGTILKNTLSQTRSFKVAQMFLGTHLLKKRTPLAECLCRMHITELQRLLNNALSVMLRVVKTVMNSSQTQDTTKTYFC